MCSSDLLKILLSGSSDGEEDFDILGPTSWPVESCFPMGARVSLSTHDTLLALRRMRCVVMNAFFFGIMRISSVFGMCIQWRLYEAAQIWKLKVRNWAKFILLDIPSLSFVRGEFPQISPSI